MLIQKRPCAFVLTAVIVAMSFHGQVVAQEDKSKEPKVERASYVELNKNPYPSTYKRLASVPTAITNATVLTGTGQLLENATVLMADGKIEAVGSNVDVPSGTKVIDGTGKWVSPGVIDAHSHLGIFGAGGVAALRDGNEATSPNTAQVWAEHALWPQDPGFTRALAAGVTTIQVLPGSANLFGGRSVTVKNIPSVTRSGMKFPGAPYGLKMACGENPKGVYGKKGGPGTRMGNMAGYRKAWAEAVAYKAKWEKYKAEYEAGKNPSAPKQDHKLDTLVGVLDGEITIQNHCYRADEMVDMINMSKEFGYHQTAFHHGIDSYKIADILAENDICAAVWADWWGFKQEAQDGIDENAAMIAAAGGCAVIKSDSNDGIQRLYIETAKAWADGRKVGIDISKGDAFKWITSNAAKMIGVADQTGSLEVGKMADVVLWSGDPFSVYTLANQVFIDGALLYDRNNPQDSWQTDFELEYTTRGAHQ